MSLLVTTCGQTTHKNRCVTAVNEAPGTVCKHDIVLIFLHLNRDSVTALCWLELQMDACTLRLRSLGELITLSIKVCK